MHFGVIWIPKLEKIEKPTFWEILDPILGKNLLKHFNRGNLDLANTFNQHFATIGLKVGNSILPVDGHFSDFLTKRDVKNKPFIDLLYAFYLSPTIPDEVAKIIDSLSIKTSVVYQFTF